MSFQTGEQVGPYRIIEQLGQGGMATVFKAYHAALDRYIAIKALHPAFKEDPNFLARFQREARVVAKLEHPNIVPIYDFAEHDGRPYLVMKYIEGETLKARLTKARITNEEILTMVEAVGAALSYAHQQGILHRDVKPSNVLISNDGHIYLADFGLARIAQSTESTLTGDMMVGTPQYISPEQALSEKNLDARTDVYSFGIMMYEMVVGRVPYNADTPFSVIHDHIYTPLPLPTSVNPDCPEVVQRVLLKALAKNPDDRYESVSSLVQAFRMAMEGQDPDKYPSTVLDQAAPTFTPTITPPILPDPTPQPAAATLAIEPAKTEAAVLTSPPMPPVVAALENETRPARNRKKPSGFSRFLKFAGIGILVLIVLCIVTGIITNAAKKGSASATQAVTTPLVQPAGQVTPLGTPAAGGNQYSAADMKALLIKVLGEWQAGDTNTAMKDFRAMQTAGPMDQVMSDFVMKTFEDNNAWLPLTYYLFSIYNSTPDELSPELVQLLHEAVYKAASDPNSADFFDKNSNKPILTVAKIRHDLVAQGTSTAQTELDAILVRPLVMREFPEAKALEIEILIQTGKINMAQQRLTALQNDKNLPDWLKTYSTDLAQKINSSK